MLRGVALAASQLLTQGQRLKSIATNLANVDTPGYRQDLTSQQSFAQVLLSRLDQRSGAIGPSDLGSILSRPTVDLSSGSLDQTGRPLDVALAGPGFFVVQAPDGLRYSRRGAFHQDGSGQLVSLEGWPVLGTNGPLTAKGPMTISPAGQVVAPGTSVGQLRVATFATGATFDRRDGTYLVPANGSPPTTVSAPVIVPGSLEGSNVDLTATMTDMLDATRSYQAAQRALSTEDGALSTLINATSLR